MQVLVCSTICPYDSFVTCFSLKVRLKVPSIPQAKATQASVIQAFLSQHHPRFLLF